jgi:hypothetical protein
MNNNQFLIFIIHFRKDCFVPRNDVLFVIRSDSYWGKEIIALKSLHSSRYCGGRRNLILNSFIRYVIARHEAILAQYNLSHNDILVFDQWFSSETQQQLGNR